MNPADLSIIEGRRQALLGQLRSAEASLRASLRARGFGSIAHEHLERALAHLQEAYIAINETKAVRSVPQLVEDLTRIEQVCRELRQQPPPGVTVKSLRP
jgi:uncharacterized membrane protein YccC